MNQHPDFELEHHSRFSSLSCNTTTLAITAVTLSSFHLLFLLLLLLHHLLIIFTLFL